MPKNIFWIFFFFGGLIIRSLLRRVSVSATRTLHLMDSLHFSPQHNIKASMYIMSVGDLAMYPLLGMVGLPSPHSQTD